MNAILVPALLLACGADEKPTPAVLPLGKDTTFVLGPLDKYGYVDYEDALNAELSRNVTADRNANVLLLQVLGPTPEGAELPAEYYRWLDAPIPPKDGEYFLGIYAFTRDVLTDDQRMALYEVMSRGTQRPWAAKDSPPLAEWLKVNEKQLALAVEATKRPDYFNPLCSRRKPGESSNLIGTLLPTVQKCRELGSALACRAMLRLGEGKPDEAWADIVACHRLGRLVSRGATLIESLVGVAICQIASTATVAYLDRADLTAAQALARMKELRALPPLAPLADKMGVSERMVGLDAVQLLRRGGDLNRDFGQEGNPTEEQRKALAAVDWTPTMLALNKFYDRLAAAMRLADRTAREQALEAIEKELAGLVKDRDNVDIQKVIKEAGTGKEAGKKLGDVLLVQLSPAVRKVQQAHDRIAQVGRNLEVAFAMQAYRADAGRYPAKLADLAPKYLAAVPDDLFAGRPLIYKPTETGYLFYSVGPNGKDDDGRWYTDDPPGDDPGVRLPLPEPKKK
jgi:hypothetical protein